MLISPAHAQAASGGGAGIEAFLPLILIFVVFYFLLIRPQQKKMKEHRNMLEAIRRGDEVITGGGIIGKVTKVVEGEDRLVVEIADGVKVNVQQSAVSAVVNRTEPVGESKKDGKAKKDDGGEGSGGGLKKLLGGKKD